MCSHWGWKASKQRCMHRFFHSKALNSGSRSKAVIFTRRPLCSLVLVIYFSSYGASSCLYIYIYQLNMAVGFFHRFFHNDPKLFYLFQTLIKTLMFYTSLFKRLISLWDLYPDSVAPFTNLPTPPCLHSALRLRLTLCTWYTIAFLSDCVCPQSLPNSSNKTPASKGNPPSPSLPST